MSSGPRVLRVFLSSTAIDMKGCREKVRETILQLQQLPIGMETFTALPTTPALDCQAESARSDIVVVLVAYRYGHVPRRELGGDGEHSITWLEVLAAKNADKPVYAFVVDPKAEWHQLKETDRLNSEPKEKRAEILAAVDGLNDFRAYLEANCTLATFSNCDDLARNVATTLSNHIMSMKPGAGQAAKVWRPSVCYLLQPAPHFRGRQHLRNKLLEWARSRVTADRVFSVVAVGGTGKTALVEHVLHELYGSDGKLPAGLFVWSFYENPRTEEFLSAACAYFTGQMPPTGGGLLERLQMALTGDEPHLLVLDGLERVQAEGATGRHRGILEDPQLRRLVRWLAAGQGTHTRALITSRFGLVDLDDWKDAGHHEERLDDLEPEAGRAVLRGWGVKGDDATLDALVAPLGYHALSVAVLGSYLGKVWGGDPTKAPTFDRGELAAADPKAAKLTRILAEYADQLPDAERDLLARLSTFPRTVSLESLFILSKAGGQIAGALVGYDQGKLMIMLQTLRDWGLVFRYETPEGARFTAHPFLRDYFQGLLGVTISKDIHETVAKRIARLDDRPKVFLTDPVVLDRYETVIEHTLLAGQPMNAVDLYYFAMGGYPHLGRDLSDNTRGFRITSSFSSDGSPESLDLGLIYHFRSMLAVDYGLFAKNLGNLVMARRAFSFSSQLWKEFEDEGNVSFGLCNQAEVELLAGLLPKATELASKALVGATKANDREGGRCCCIIMAAALGRLGRILEAETCFATGVRSASVRNYYFGGDLLNAEFRLACGDKEGAITQSRAIKDFCVQHKQSDTQAKSDTLLGLLALPDDPVAARRHLGDARNYAFRSGHVEVQLRCYCLAAEVARLDHAYGLACSEAEAGIHLADTCGFGYYSIELRLALARAHLDACDVKAALKRAREALDRSVHPECQYAWGEADGLHLCGVAHARLGEIELARQRLMAARTGRDRLRHPGLPETQAALARLGVSSI